MDPILRRSSLFYLSTFVIFTGVLGRFLGRDAWPAFEVIPLFMPVYLLAGVMSSESNERYAFLRQLPVSDHRIAGTKFGLITVSASLYWVFMTLIGLARMSEGTSGPTTLVYVTIVCGVGLLLGTSFQIGIWQFGHSKVLPAALVVGGLNLAIAIVHTASLRRSAHWPVLARLGPIEWMGRSPWLSIPVLAVLFAAATVWLFRVGVRVKERSEAAL